MEPWLVALVSAIASGSVTIFGAVYWFGRNSVTKDDLRELRDLAVQHRDELRGDIESERREFGEGLKALRQHIGNVELDIAKNYVRRDTWHHTVNQMQETSSRADAADQQWKLRIEEKLDRLAERITS